MGENLGVHNAAAAIAGTGHVFMSVTTYLCNDLFDHERMGWTWLQQYEQNKHWENHSLGTYSSSGVYTTVTELNVMQGTVSPSGSETFFVSRGTGAG